MHWPCCLQASSLKSSFRTIGPLPQAPLKLTPRNFTLEQNASMALKNPAVLPVQREAILQNGEGEGEALICFAMVCALNPPKATNLLQALDPRQFQKHTRIPRQAAFLNFKCVECPNHPKPLGPQPRPT